METPWSDLKIAFDITAWHDDVFDYLEKDSVKDMLPEGWVLDCASGNGTRTVVIFRVQDKVPTIEDKEIIQKILDSMPEI